MIKSWWLVALFIISVLLGAGVLLLITRPPRGEAITLLPIPTQAPITVYVSGRVNQIGLYTLPPGSRVNDAIQAAGGFAADADSNLINLAEILVDGEQIVVPSLLPTAVTNSNSRGENPISIPLVDINSATLDQLDTLPEIGLKTAQTIINYRNTNGPFTKIEEILDVPGIGQATFEKIKGLITTGTSP